MSSGRIIRKEGDQKLGLSIIGNLSCGIKEEGKKYPRSIDYFRPRGKYVNYFQKAYGDTPSTIHVMFISDVPNEACKEEYEYRDDSGRLWGKGDGMEFLIWNEKKDRYELFNAAEYPDIMDRLHAKINSKRGWTETLTLRFLLPKISNVIGLWQLSTKGSHSSIPNIVETFNTVLNYRQSVKGVIFDLNVELVKSQKPGAQSKFPVITMVLNNSDENLAEVKGNLLNKEQHLLNGPNEH